MFRFTIRDLLWLTVVVALAVGWWLDRNRLAKSIGRMEGIANTLRTQLELKVDDEVTVILPDGTTYPEGAKVD